MYKCRTWNYRHSSSSSYPKPAEVPALLHKNKSAVGQVDMCTLLPCPLVVVVVAVLVVAAVESSSSGSGSV